MLKKRMFLAFLVMVLYNLGVLFGIVNQEALRNSSGIISKFVDFSNLFFGIFIVFVFRLLSLKDDLGKNENQYIKGLFVLYFLLILMTYFMSGTIRPFQINTLFGSFVFGYALYLSQNKMSYIYFLKSYFVIIVACYAIELVSKGNSISLQSIMSGYITSEAPSESVFSFVFCLFVPLFLYLRERKFFYISTFMTIISFKRIAILAMIISIILTYILEKKMISLNKIKAIILGVVIVYVSFIVSFANGAYDKIILNFTGETANKFSLGRQDLYLGYVNYENALQILGKGVGFITINEKGSYLQLHSGLLENFIEFGPFFYLCWILLLLKLNKSNMAIVNLVLLLVMMMTDNVFKYGFFQVPFYFLTLYYLKNNSVNQLKEVK